MSDVVRDRTDRHTDLLDAAVDHVLVSGFEKMSLRTLAGALGVAHNTLTHHFGDRASLQHAILVRLAERVQRDTRAVLPEGAEPSDTVDAVLRMRTVFEWMADASRRPVWAAFYESIALAVRDPTTNRAFLSHVENDWVEPLAAEFERIGTDAGTARARAVLIVATTRGLVMDVVVSGPSGITRARDALEEFLPLVAGWIERRAPVSPSR
ncbi:transcriptional regulator, TetR family [Rhodococcoides kroppenstedtii]|uniref:Transcriptional regulator, TetR family n=1 Tax=Rhodococcoides kroppenstedtii TaxID=293050 RepID=A0A1I0SSJ3_9NOCA|nr:TetR/AcrR family transcriptional regulator [Rhodococcus kroppenstedtii]SFA41736.1 transcriptional regulator, TetR family [Rhodococcus kroppenstedtii]